MEKQKVAKQSFSIKYRDIDILITYKKIKNIILKIDRCFNVTISAPIGYTIDDIVGFIKINEKWIYGKLSSIKKDAIKSNEIIILGKIYTIFYGQKYNFLIDGNSIFAKNSLVLEKNLKDKLKRIFWDIYFKYKHDIGKSVNHLSIKKMKTRYGSCNFKKGYINLNLNLIKFELPLIEYVILHELAHLIYPNHQEGFYKFIQSIMPDFKSRENRLKIK